VGISWKRFVVYAVALVISANILPSLPPFTWSVTETIEDTTGSVRPVAPPALPEPPATAQGTQGARPGDPHRRSRPAVPASPKGLDISIDESGIRIKPRAKAASQPASGASQAVDATGEPVAPKDTQVHIALPKGVDKEAVREAVEDAKAAIEDAIAAKREAAEEAAAAAREAQQAAREAERAMREAAREAGISMPGPTSRIKRTRKFQWGDFLTDLALLWIMASAIIKATYKGRIQAEVKAAQATETAEAESLKRQVVEARMAAMQAQVEPHFLFNTLASIDHLIEVDPKRASQMQKNLIALLRASMPTMRETGSEGSRPRDLGRELAVIRPYLEILQVRMEERLATEIDVPDGLLSAEFPAMMVQTLVENAIKHGLEPKAEGGELSLKAEVVHGKLTVSVADTGLGFGRAAPARRPAPAWAWPTSASGCNCCTAPRPA
jgi:hypothetical protein